MASKLFKCQFQCFCITSKTWQRAPSKRSSQRGPNLFIFIFYLGSVLPSTIMFMSDGAWTKHQNCHWSVSKTSNPTFTFLSKNDRCASWQKNRLLFRTRWWRNFRSIGRRPFLEQMLFGQERKLQFFSFKVFSIKKQKTDRSLNCLASFLFLPFLPKVIFWPSWATFYGRWRYVFQK